MKFGFEARVAIELEFEKGMKHSNLVGTKINLDTHNVDKKVYIDENDLPTKEGAKQLTNVLIQGLIANIHINHQLGFRNDAEHIQYIIDELQRGFVSHFKAGEGTF